ncbi:hypothetical protein HPDP_00327 [Candidatus Hepatincola sp. Pdp]
MNLGFKLVIALFLITTLSSCMVSYSTDSDDLSRLQDSSNRDSTSVEYAEDAAWNSYVKGGNRRAILQSNNAHFNNSAVLNSQEWEIEKVNEFMVATSVKDKVNGLSYTLLIKDCSTEALGIGSTNLTTNGNLTLNVNGKDIPMNVANMLAFSIDAVNRDYIIGQLLHNKKIIVKDENGKIMGAYNGKGFAEMLNDIKTLCEVEKKKSL